MHLEKRKRTKEEREEGGEITHFEKPEPLKSLDPWKPSFLAVPRHGVFFFGFRRVDFLGSQGPCEMEVDFKKSVKSGHFKAS